MNSAPRLDQRDGMAALFRANGQALVVDGPVDHVGRVGQEIAVVDREDR